MIAPSPKTFAELVGYSPSPISTEHTHGTTVIMLRYDEGVLTLADRRATIGNLIMFEQADKVMALDDQTVVAISGSYAKAFEVCRFLKHSFKYYARMHLQPMSLDGKLQEISRTLVSNLGSAMEGIGLFLPILGAYDPRLDDFRVFFFDAAGAKFDGDEYAAAGSGSERIRGIFEYQARTKGPWSKRKLKDALFDGLTMLDIAADLDSATGGFVKIPPIARVLDRQGTRPLPNAMVDETVKRVLAIQ
ncbi:MAG: Proteasome subunit beta [Fimbriimonadaceae bacterium]|nr:Proteasome subunit beta [Fimbriimonadaceae bacterium]